MKARVFSFVGALVALVFTVGSLVVRADDESRERKRFVAVLNGYGEVPTRASGGSGMLVVLIDDQTSTISYQLSYANLDGNVLAAHVHLGASGVAGGVSFFLCGGGTAPPCSPPPAMISGSVVASDVIGPKDQGIAAGEFAKIVAGIRHHSGYANVHSSVAPAGEIRGQLE
jgi:hypothetical protein